MNDVREDLKRVASDDSLDIPEPKSEPKVAAKPPLKFLDAQKERIGPIEEAIVVWTQEVDDAKSRVKRELEDNDDHVPEYGDQYHVLKLFKAQRVLHNLEAALEEAEKATQ